MNPLPPRYSSLEGALSPEAANILRSLYATPIHGDDQARQIYPPRYSGVFQRSNSSVRHHRRHHHLASGNRYGTDSQLVAGLHHFEYHIKTGHGSRAQPWATLRLCSRSSSTSVPSSTVVVPGKMPKFTSNDLVQGCLELKLDSPMNINSISLSVRPTLNSINSRNTDIALLVAWKNCHRFIRRWKLHLSQLPYHQLDARTWRSTHCHLES